jgi:hypothetical protein
VEFDMSEEQSTNSAEMRFAGKTILVVDPDPHVVALLHNKLSSHGARVVVAHSLERGMALAAAPGITAAVVGQWIGTEEQGALCGQLLRSRVPFAFIPNAGRSEWDFDRPMKVVNSYSPPHIQEGARTLFSLAELLSRRYAH